MKDLGLSSQEIRILKEMVGPRYKDTHDGGKLTLTCDRFPNRIENKRYIIYLLESLLAETRAICAKHLEGLEQLKQENREKNLLWLKQQQNAASEQPNIVGPGTSSRY